MERTTNADQRGKIGGVCQPQLFRRKEVVDLFLHFLKKDLPDIVIDAFGIGVETGIGRQRILHGNLLEDFFFDFDPVAGIAGYGSIRPRRLGPFCLDQAQTIEIVQHAILRVRLSHEESAQIIPWQQADRLRKLRVALFADTTDSHRRRLCIRYRGVA